MKEYVESILPSWTVEDDPNGGVRAHSPGRRASIHIRRATFAAGDGYLADLWVGDGSHSAKHHGTQRAAITREEVAAALQELAEEAEVESPWH